MLGSKPWSYKQWNIIQLFCQLMYWLENVCIKHCCCHADSCGKKPNSWLRCWFRLDRLKYWNCINLLLQFYTDFDIGHQVGLSGFFFLPFTSLGPCLNPTSDQSLECGVVYLSVPTWLRGFSPIWGFPPTSKTEHFFSFPIHHPC